MEADATRARRRVARTVLAALIAVCAAGCAKEPPPEERMSLKDSWANGTTVTYADGRPVNAAYTPPPQAEPAPKVVSERPQPQPQPPAAAPAPPKQVAPARPAPSAPPTLALSPPKVETPPPATAPASPAPAPSPTPPKPLAETDLATGRCGDGRDCLDVLRAMIDDPKQSWMMRAPTAVEFANGTRLFAYRALKSTLECGKLRFANAELDWAIDTFHSNRVTGVDAAHRARVAALAEAVHEEIEAEIKKRC